MTTMFDVGDRPRTKWRVQLEGTLADPPIVMLIVRDPAGDEHVSIFGEVGQPYPITRESAGVYFADIPLNAKGNWYRRWVAFDELGEPLDAFEGAIKVRGSALTEPLPELTP